MHFDRLTYLLFICDSLLVAKANQQFRWKFWKCFGRVLRCANKTQASPQSVCLLIYTMRAPRCLIIKYSVNERFFVFLFN